MAGLVNAREQLVVGVIILRQLSPLGTRESFASFEKLHHHASPSPRAPACSSLLVPRAALARLLLGVGASRGRRVRVARAARFGEHMVRIGWGKEEEEDERERQ